VSVAFDGTPSVRRATGLRVDRAQRLALQRAPDGRAYATLERPLRKACASYTQTQDSDLFGG
jgi:hypothetical protein